MHRALCRSGEEKGAAADGPAGSIALVLKGVEPNAVVEQMLENCAQSSADPGDLGIKSLKLCLAQRFFFE